MSTQHASNLFTIPAINLGMNIAQPQLTVKIKYRYQLAASLQSLIESVPFDVIVSAPVEYAGHEAFVSWSEIGSGVEPFSLNRTTPFEQVVFKANNPFGFPSIYNCGTSKANKVGTYLLFSHFN